MHGMAWFPDAPDVQKLLTPHADFDPIEAAEEIISYDDRVVSTMNPDNAPPPKKKTPACMQQWTW